MQGPLYCCVVFHTSSNHVPDGDGSIAVVNVGGTGNQDSVWRREWKCQEFIYLGNTVLDRGAGYRKSRLWRLQMRVTDSADGHTGLWERL